MADKKISQLTALSAANLAPSTDVLAIVDTSATETKKIVAQDLINGVLNVASAVGIGTASPSYKLHVVGGAAIANRTTSDTPGNISLGVLSTSSVATFGWRTDTSNNLHFDIYNGASWSAALTTSLAGNVGIGTTSPGSLWSGANRLVVGSGSAAAGLTIYTSTSTAGTLAFGDGTTGSDPYVGYVQYNHTDNTMSLGTSGTTKATLDASGNLGVGATTPGQKLEVSGNQRFTGSQVGTKIENRNTGINVSTATTILDEAGAEGRVVIVNGANGGDRFCDLVFCSTAANPTVIASFTAFGTPTARTYTRNGSALQLAMASGTYVVNALALGY